MMYGKVLTETNYFDGAPGLKKTWHEESIEITDNAHLLNEVLACLDLVLKTGVDDITVAIKRNKEGKLRLVKTHRVL